ncbi:MAG TPA: cytochrome P450 [Myxococcaceae bacterium]|nr:cytochrome P450 [Myxococcaceae bacterium]
MEILPKLPRVPALRGSRRVPVLGAAGNVFRFFGDPAGTLLRLHREFGPVAALTEQDPAWVALFGADHVQRVLSDARQFHNLAEVPIPAPEDSAPKRLNVALTSMNGDTHKRNRRLMMPAFSKQAVAGYRDLTVEVAERVLSRWRPGEPVDAHARMVELAMCVAMRTLYGLDVLTHADELSALATGWLEGLLSIGALLFPYRVPGTPYARFMSVSERLEARIHRLIAERRASPGGQDVLSLLIAARDDEAGQLSEAELVGQTGVLFVASYETTANTLAWTLLLLAQHPRVLAELEEEVRSAPLEQAPSLPLLDAVVKESQRLLPAVALLFFRRSQEPFSLGGLDLPAGTSVVVTPLVAHRDPELFPDPLDFRPERWRGGLDPGPYQYFPFGAGPRMCIGAPFATQAIRILLAMMLRRFRFELQPGARVDRMVRGITLGPKHGLPMRLRMAEGPPSPAVPLAGDLRELVNLPRA